jgi:hypothetical protein
VVGLGRAAGRTGPEVRPGDVVLRRQVQQQDREAAAMAHRRILALGGGECDELVAISA